MNCERHPNLPIYKMGMCSDCFHEEGEAAIKRLSEIRIRTASISKAIRQERQKLRALQDAHRKLSRARNRFKDVVILDVVAKEFGLTTEDLMRRYRARPVCEARQAAHYVLRQNACSLPKIGQMFGMHHTTVMHSIRTAQQREQVKRGYAARLAAVRQTIQQMEAGA